MSQHPEVQGSEPQPVEMTREKMERAFPGEWVLARLTNWKGHDPLTGVIIAHNKDDYETACHLPSQRAVRYYFFRSEEDQTGKTHVAAIIPTEDRTHNRPAPVLTTRGIFYPDPCARIAYLTFSSAN